MTRINLIIVVVLLFIGGCAEKSGLESRKMTTTSNVKKLGNEVIELSVDRSAENELQLAVENGHQPWRLRPELVACSVLFQRSPDIAFGDCKVETIDQNRAVVSATKGETIFRVHLERLVKTDGIWTGTKIEIIQK